MSREPLGLKAYALSLLARREYSRAELRGRLIAQARKRAQWQTEAGSQPGGGADPMQAFLDGEAHAAVASEAPDPEQLACEVETVLDWLAAQRHQSDARFVESRIHARAGRMGQSRIRQELSRHGLSLDEEAARSLRESELDRAREVWRKKFGELAPDAAGRARQARFLAARGFAAEVVWRLVGGRDED